MVVAVLAAALAGSGASANAQATLPAVGPVQVVAQSGSFALPLDSYFATPAQASLITEAYSVVLASCLKPFGLKPQPQSSLADTAPPTANMYGLVSLSTAETDGYASSQDASSLPQPPAPAPAQAGNDPEGSTYAQVMSGSGASAGSGIPQGGCMGQARHVLGGAQYNPVLVSDLRTHAYTDSQADPRAQASDIAWSICMTARGLPYQNPWDPYNALINQSPDPESIRTATADARCRVSTNLVGAWYTLEIAYENQAVAKDAPQLQANHAALAEMVSAAEKIIAARPSRSGDDRRPPDCPNCCATG